MKAKNSNIDNNTLQFLIKLFFLILALLFLYNQFSPYQNCIRNGGNNNYCTKNTSW